MGELYDMKATFQNLFWKWERGDSNIRELREGLRKKTDQSLNVFQKQSFITKLLKSNVQWKMALYSLLRKITTERKLKTVNIWYVLIPISAEIHNLRCIKCKKKLLYSHNFSSLFKDSIPVKPFNDNNSLWSVGTLWTGFDFSLPILVPVILV